VKFGRTLENRAPIAAAMIAAQFQPPLKRYSPFS
jgi:hypothetical protein